jgi:hypothetical protein
MSDDSHDCAEYDPILCPECYWHCPVCGKTLDKAESKTCPQNH